MPRSLSLRASVLRSRKRLSILYLRCKSMFAIQCAVKAAAELSILYLRCSPLLMPTGLISLMNFFQFSI